MTGMIRATLLAAFVSICIPAVAIAQRPSVDSLLRRIEQLERTTTDLERRVAELEALLRSEPSRAQPVSPSSKSQDLQNWRRLRLGMKMDEVRSLLGEPEKVTVVGSVAYWSFPGGGTVSFDSRSGKLESWMEP